MNLMDAAAMTIGVALIPVPIEPVRDPDGRGPEHAAWMLKEIAHGRIEGEKGHRWLGYAQALLVEAELLTMTEAKRINHAA